MKRFVACATAAMALTVAGNLSLPQATNASTASSLAEMSCKGKDGSYQARHELVMMGRQVFNGVARIRYSHFLNQLQLGKSVVIACSLAPSTSAPRFRSLNLAFGMPTDRFNGDPVTRLKIYKDGEFYGAADITKGRLLKAGIDVQGVRSISLEVECVRPVRMGSTTPGCPPIWFTEDMLTE